MVRQSERVTLYEAALELLLEQDLAYACGCSRKVIAENAAHGEEGIYPGTCYALKRQDPNGGASPNGKPGAFRFHVNEVEVCFKDRLQGEIRQHLAQAVGDFVIRRTDGPFAYQLAVVVDDASQGITHVVRGMDLLDSTPRQIALQQALGYATPQYLHLPLVLNDQGEKLSKQTKAPAVVSDPKTAAQTLRTVLTFLGLTVPHEVGGDLQQMLHYALHTTDKDLLN